MFLYLLSLIAWLILSSWCCFNSLSVFYRLLSELLIVLLLLNYFLYSWYYFILSLFRFFWCSCILTRFNLWSFCTLFNYLILSYCILVSNFWILETYSNDTFSILLLYYSVLHVFRVIYIFRKSTTLSCLFLIICEFDTWTWVLWDLFKYHGVWARLLSQRICVVLCIWGIFLKTQFFTSSVTITVISVQILKQMLPPDCLCLAR